MAPPFPRQVMRGQPREIDLSRVKGSEQGSSPFGAGGDGFGVFSIPGRNAVGIPQTSLKLIKDILDNEGGERRFDKAGLKPGH